MVRTSCVNLLSYRYRNPSPSDRTTFDCRREAGPITPFALGGMECPRGCYCYRKAGEMRVLDVAEWFRHPILVFPSLQRARVSA